MPGLSAEVQSEVLERFDAPQSLLVMSALESLAEPPSHSPEWSRARARVHLALLKLAAGNLDALRAHVETARRDWRDTLCAAGLENDDWPDVLRAAGFSVPR